MADRIVRPYANETYVTREQVERFAPAVLATQPHISRSERYQFISTLEIVRAMHDAGFFPTEVRQSSTRDPGRVAYTKHMIRFRQDGHIMQAVNDTVAEVVLINSHGGESRYKLFEGIFRLVCSNGMIVADDSKGSASVSIMHVGKEAIDQIVTASLALVAQSKERRLHIEEMKSVVLTMQEQHAFIRSAALLRFPETAIDENLVVALNRPIRSEDNSADLWTTFNRAQEKLINGGTRVNAGNGYRRKSRPVNSIDGNVKLNTALWTLTQEMLKLKKNG